jgi:inner membrane protein
MDPVSHSLLGASLGFAAFGHRLGRTAALAGGLTGLVPDADIFIRSAADPLLAIEYHRGFTHSLPFAPFGAAVVAAILMLRTENRGRPVLLWACCLLAYLSHCMLDAATSYGTQLYWPFSRHRAGWDVISIIDPLFTGALALGLTWGLLHQRRRPAAVALAIAAGYLAFGIVQHARAGAAQRELAEARGHGRERIEVMPTLANNVIWRALYVHEGRIHSDRIRVGWFSRPTVREGWSLPLVDETELTPAERARNTGRRSFERFSWFSDDWVARDPARLMVLGDMRYSLSTEAFDPIWGIRFTPPTEPAEVVWVNRSRDRKIDVGELWREIAGTDDRYRALGPGGNGEPATSGP